MRCSPARGQPDKLQCSDPVCHTESGAPCALMACYSVGDPSLLRLLQAAGASEVLPLVVAR